MPKLADFFKDKQGRIVIAQTPNSPLIGWALFTILAWIWKSHQVGIYNLFGILAFGFIFTWAWLEITSGVNWFRRTLGIVVLIVAVWFRLM